MDSSGGFQGADQNISTRVQMSNIYGILQRQLRSAVAQEHLDICPYVRTPQAAVKVDGPGLFVTTGICGDTAPQQPQKKCDSLVKNIDRVWGAVRCLQ